MLPSDLRGLFDRTGQPALFTGEVLTDLHAMDKRPWSEYRAGKPITSHQLSALLKPLGVRPNTIRRSERTSKGYERKNREDSFARYLTPVS
jgi:Protein of unknown function (DUF3631)